MSSTKTAEPIEMPFEGMNLSGPKEPCIRSGAHWCHLPNTTEQSMCGGDAALCHNDASTCYCYDCRPCEAVV